jgi:hypothetical protein
MAEAGVVPAAKRYKTGKKTPKPQSDEAGPAVEPMHQPVSDPEPEDKEETDSDEEELEPIPKTKRPEHLFGKTAWYCEWHGQWYWSKEPGAHQSRSCKKMPESVREERKKNKTPTKKRKISNPDACKECQILKAKIKDLEASFELRLDAAVAKSESKMLREFMNTAQAPGRIYPRAVVTQLNHVSKIEAPRKSVEEIIKAPRPERRAWYSSSTEEERVAYKKLKHDDKEEE